MDYTGGGEGITSPIPKLTATVTEEPTTMPTETPAPTVTPDVEATNQAEFETKKAEALKMVSIKLDSPEDLKNLPVLDDVADFDSSEVQEAEHFLINHFLPPADIKLPDTLQIVRG